MSEVMNRPYDVKNPNLTKVSDSTIPNSGLDDDYISLIAKFYNTTTDNLNSFPVTGRRDPVEVDPFCPVSCNMLDGSYNILKFPESLPVGNVSKPVFNVDELNLGGGENNPIDSAESMGRINLQEHENILPNKVNDVDIAEVCYVPIGVFPEGSHETKIQSNVVSEINNVEDSGNNVKGENAAESEDVKDGDFIDEDKFRSKTLTLRHVNNVSLDPKPLMVFNVYIERVKVESY